MGVLLSVYNKLPFHSSSATELAQTEDKWMNIDHASENRHAVEDDTECTSPTSKVYKDTSRKYAESLRPIDRDATRFETGKRKEFYAELFDKEEIKEESVLKEKFRGKKKQLELSGVMLKESNIFFSSDESDKESLTIHTEDLNRRGVTWENVKQNLKEKVSDVNQALDKTGHTNNGGSSKIFRDADDAAISDGSSKSFQTSQQPTMPGLIDDAELSRHALSISKDKEDQLRGLVKSKNDKDSEGKVPNTSAVFPQKSVSPGDVRSKDIVPGDGVRAHSPTGGDAVHSKKKKMEGKGDSSKFGENSDAYDTRDKKLKVRKRLSKKVRRSLNLSRGRKSSKVVPLTEERETAGQPTSSTSLKKPHEVYKIFDGYARRDPYHCEVLSVERGEEYVTEAGWGFGPKSGLESGPWPFVEAKKSSRLSKMKFWKRRRETEVEIFKPMNNKEKQDMMEKGWEVHSKAARRGDGKEKRKKISKFLNTKTTKVKKLLTPHADETLDPKWPTFVASTECGKNSSSKRTEEKISVFSKLKFSKRTQEKSATEPMSSENAQDSWFNEGDVLNEDGEQETVQIRWNKVKLSNICVVPPRPSDVYARQLVQRR